MTAVDTVVGSIPEEQHRRELRKAVIASTVGTTIEWYDFLLYSVVTPLVFGKLFFPHSEPLIGVLEAFSIYFVGFVGRPIGAFIFGHFGDRIGRKAALIATLLITGLSTFAVGFVPGYASIGIWGAVILTVVRMIQGIGVGGEWGGSVLFAMEWARTNKHRGFITSWPQFGGPAGLFLANMAVLIGSAIAGDSFFDWGWRIPFWLSIIMVAIGLYIRLGILETPVFRRIVAEERVERVPALEVMKRQPKQVFLSMFARSAEQGPAYIYLAFIFAYNNQVMHMSRDFVLTALIIAGLISFISIPLAGAASDRFGRKRVYIIGSLLTGIYGFIYFGLLNSLVPALIVIAIIVSFIPHDIMYGPQAALIAEGFTPRLRYSGCSIGYQLASLTAGGPAPLIATALFAAYGSSLPIAGYIAFMAVVSIVATALMKDYTGKDISEESA
ncbi:MAG: MHS family MFS transporter [Alphaproteobacteria bacterium]|nr:MHS family MFS transporter [Alphaproteobacteria bacterium]MBV9586101.1 MHS family MFS transporter [Alphaproteobacteria bacterium]MBV9967917.1 MHS family MFS transporter [Alphaproteobacteria bacterium]